MLQELDKILKEEPDKAEYGAVKKWKQLGPIDVERWKQIVPDYAPIIDDQTVELKERIYDPDCGICYGQFLKGTKIKHGIVRKISKLGYIYEEQWLNNERHGYSRTIWDDGEYSEGYWKFGKEEGDFSQFDNYRYYM